MTGNHWRWLAALDCPPRRVGIAVATVSADKGLDEFLQGLKFCCLECKEMASLSPTHDDWMPDILADPEDPPLCCYCEREIL